MELALEILKALFKAIPDLITLIGAWFNGTGDENNPIYNQVAEILDGAQSDLDRAIENLGT